LTSSTSSASNLLQSDVSTVHTTAKPTAGGGGGGGGGGPNNSSNIPTNDPLDIYPITQVVLGNFIPIIIARGYIAFVGPYYHQLLLHEPIRLLTDPGGAPFSAIAGFPGSAIPLNLALITAEIGSAFTAGVTFLDTGYCDDPNGCTPRLSSISWVVDVVITAVVIQIITIVVQACQWWKKPSAISCDPTNIIGVAVVMGHPQIEEEFSSLPSELTALELKARLKGHKYKLGLFQTERGIVKYGIMPAEESVPFQEMDTRRKEGIYTKLGNRWMKFQSRFKFLNNWRKTWVYFDSIFVMFLLALLGLTIAAVSRINEQQVVFLATAAASGTGMRIFFAILGVIVSSYWGRIFRGKPFLQ
jgi:hypothetical protein